MPSLLEGIPKHVKAHQEEVGRPWRSLMATGAAVAGAGLILGAPAVTLLATAGTAQAAPPEQAFCIPTVSCEGDDGEGGSSGAGGAGGGGAGGSASAPVGGGTTTDGDDGDDGADGDDGSSTDGTDGGNTGSDNDDQRLVRESGAPA